MRAVDFICECANEHCAERISLRLSRYEEIRANGHRFFVRPGHDVPEVEDIVDAGDGYVVVVKLGAGTRVADGLDPRSRTR